MTKAKPGDVIVIDWPSHKELHNKECVVVDRKTVSATLTHASQCIWLRRMGYDSVFWVLTKRCKVIQQETDLFVSSGVLDDIHSWVNDEKVKKAAAMIGQSSYPKTCPDCKGTGRITMLNWDVDCNCMKNTSTKKKGCGYCKYDYCECDNTCDYENGDYCGRCDVWCCETCLMEGVCGSCYSKIQGGVN